MFIRVEKNICSEKVVVEGADIEDGLLALRLNHDCEGQLGNHYSSLISRLKIINKWRMASFEHSLYENIQSISLSLSLARFLTNDTAGPFSMWSNVYFFLNDALWQYERMRSGSPMDRTLQRASWYLLAKPPQVPSPWILTSYSMSWGTAIRFHKWSAQVGWKDKDGRFM